MGQLSGWVLLSFVGLHVGLVLCAVALGSPNWLQGSCTHENNTNGTNSTGVDANLDTRIYVDNPARDTRFKRDADIDGSNTTTGASTTGKTGRTTTGGLNTTEAPRTTGDHNATDAPNTTSAHHTTVHVTSTTEKPAPKLDKETLGLWKYCVNDQCQGTISMKDQPGWFKGARICEVMAVAAIVVGLVFYYAFLLCKTCENSTGVSSMLVILILIAAATATASVALFGQHTRTGFPNFLSELKQLDHKFGWTFYVACVAAGVLYVSGACMARAVCLVKQRARASAYENI